MQLVVGGDLHRRRPICPLSYVGVGLRVPLCSSPTDTDNRSLVRRQ